ncbi:MAG: Uma2 family endonuclease [Cyanobacteria bacterium P01_G01_bin.54]
MQRLTRKFTTTQYHQMAQAGILTPDERIELIAGEIIPMSPIGLKHLAMVNRLANFLPLQLSGRAIVSVQNPIRLNDFSEPQPDLALLKPQTDFYASKLPEPNDCLLLLEVADSSLRSDQEVKAPLYAQNQIQDYWLIDVENNTVTIYRDPQAGVYQRQVMLQPKGTISPLVFPKLVLKYSNFFDTSTVG